MGAPHLSPRQLDILRLTANGYTDQATARRLGLSIHTVRDQWRWGIRPRLGAANHSHAVALAFSAGLLTESDVHQHRQESAA
ncbi:hypothetical protein XF35_40325 [Streptomyces platensis subsp. clarensis]|uniref:HTH luxR-type domain-containing protein n=1 Tax=Streptomyces showdoensis TaxID=68268 RepID=A0A2P2GKS9_STREW|nr:helix-turn-helix transcriptional regulator [Streptomyces showdoensis]KKZ72108.1 hypothetical protein VO63_20245 [Streptomyces showdoensis]MCW7991286.1 hypothetical protein [Streptomyces platensis subsp. clarensis]